MRLKISVVVVLMSFFALFFASGASADGTWTVDLVAGQHTTVGTVTIVRTGNNLNVTYAITAAGWCLEATHLYVGSTPPRRAAPGRFPYKHKNLGCVQSDTFNVTANTANPYIAAHAKVVSSSTSSPSLQINAGQVNLTVAFPGGDSYFNTTVSGAISGTFNGWCVDMDRLISSGINYTAAIYSSYGTLPAGTVDHPENLDLINYIINQDYISQGMTYADIQVAIWSLIDNIVGNPGGWTQANVNAIIADAQAHGEGFTPTCGQVMAVILLPSGDVAQHTIIEYPVPCTTTSSGQHETAWALVEGGFRFKQGWGMYFQLN